MDFKATEEGEELIVSNAGLNIQLYPSRNHFVVAVYFYLFLGHLIWHVGFSSPTRIEPVHPALGAWSLIHWTIREVLK